MKKKDIMFVLTQLKANYRTIGLGNNKCRVEIEHAESKRILASAEGFGENETLVAAVQKAKQGLDIPDKAPEGDQSAEIKAMQKQIDELKKLVQSSKTESVTPETPIEAEDPWADIETAYIRTIIEEAGIGITGNPRRTTLIKMCVENDIQPPQPAASVEDDDGA